MNRNIILTILFAFATTIMSFAQSSIEGVWFNTSKSGKIEIYKVGEEYFGKIIWLEEPLSETTGEPKVDENNPKDGKRNTPIIGLVVLKGFEYDGEGKFTGGTIYDPENGKTYKCKMTMDGDALDVRGYIGFPALGRTENWTRATE